jgi:Domain of unknown function (DUF4412)
MRYPLFAAAIAAVVLMLVTAGTPVAGVVMAETSTAHGPNGETFSVDRTIYVQGNKQKVERERVTTVTDLDKSIIYIIDKSERVYTEMPLQALSPTQPGNMQSGTIHLNKTGETRVIADQPCDEYRRVEENKLERVTINLCVSTGAPGTKEVSQFERKMAARLDGGKSEQSADNAKASMMLEKESVLSFRVPDPSRRQAYRTASLLVETRVNNIQMKPLPPETFKPPKGYSKLQNRPRTAPSDSLEAPDHIVDVIPPNLLFYS